jgi:hypothetical protein
VNGAYMAARQASLKFTTLHEDDPDVAPLLTHAGGDICSMMHGAGLYIEARGARPPRGVGMRRVPVCASASGLMRLCVWAGGGGLFSMHSACMRVCLHVHVRVCACMCVYVHVRGLVCRIF